MLNVSSFLIIHLTDPFFRGPGPSNYCIGGGGGGGVAPPTDLLGGGQKLAQKM